MRVEVQAPPNRQKLCTLHSASRRGVSSRSLRSSGSQRSQACVCLCSQQYSLQLGSPSSDSVRAALSVRRRRCHQITQQFAALAAESSMSLEDQRSHGRAITLRLLRFPSNHPWFRRTFVVTFCVRASHADVCPELLQDAGEPRDHVQDGAPHRGCRLVHQVVKLRDMALHVRVLLAQQACARCIVRSGPGSPVLAAKRVERVLRKRLLTHIPTIAFPQSTRGARGPHPALHRAVAPWPSSIAHSVPVLSVTWAWPSSTCQCKVQPHWA